MIPLTLDKVNAKLGLKTIYEYAIFGIQTVRWLLKKIVWIKSSKKDLMEFPIDVRREIGYALYRAQLGETHSSAKLFKGYGSGIYEIVSDYNTNTYRAVYTVQFNECIYVLHSFQKKSKTGIKTPKKELNVIMDRLKYLKFMLK
jgi:phage-related protein